MQCASKFRMSGRNLNVGDADEVVVMAGSVRSCRSRSFISVVECCEDALIRRRDWEDGRGRVGLLLRSLVVPVLAVDYGNEAVYMFTEVTNHEGSCMRRPGSNGVVKRGRS